MDKMNRKVSRIIHIAPLVALLLAVGLMFQAVYGQETIQISIERSGKGLSFYINKNKHWSWAGETIVRIGGSEYTAYCIEPEVQIIPGLNQMQVQQVIDNSSWRSISYILTWYHPPEDDRSAAEIQGAIWRFLDVNPSSYGSSIYNEALNKDVVRPGDTLTLTPQSGETSLGGSVTLKAKLTDSKGRPRPGVKILFSTTMGTLDKTEGITNENGEVTVKLMSTELGKAKVKAWTRGIWVNGYLTSDENQDLIVIGYTTTMTKLTETSNIIFTTSVIPETPYGTLSALASLTLALFAFAFFKRRLNLKLN
ncbi:Ig-like domain-containing protein [Candidatus Bathyarchaeota archaeon]|nr:Ig-like domain-containing protein [Candidatus Bathyarchaeota archaeon]